MRRLPGILLLTGATLVVIVALLVSGLRLALPHLDSWRPQIPQNRIRHRPAGGRESYRGKLAELWPDA